MGTNQPPKQNGRTDEKRGKAISPGKPAPALGWRFMEVSLSKAQKDQFKAWKTDLSELFGLLAAYNQIGVKFAFSRNNRSDSYICSVTDTNETSPNYGITFTSHAPTPNQAFALAVWKLEFILSFMDTWTAQVDKDELFG